MTTDPIPPRVPGGLFLVGAVPGLLQAAATFLPATRIRLFGGTFSFLQIHSTGGVLLLLGLIMALTAAQRRTRWLAISSGLSLAITAAVYVGVRWHPSRTFVDPVLRRAIRPGWGFGPMFLAGGLGLLVAGWLYLRRPKVDKLAFSPVVAP